MNSIRYPAARLSSSNAGFGTCTASYFHSVARYRFQPT